MMLTLSFGKKQSVDKLYHLLVAKMLLSDLYDFKLKSMRLNIVHQLTHVTFSLLKVYAIVYCAGNTARFSLINLLKVYA